MVDSKIFGRADGFGTTQGVPGRSDCDRAAIDLFLIVIEDHIVSPELIFDCGQGSEKARRRLEGRPSVAQKCHIVHIVTEGGGEVQLPDRCQEALEEVFGKGASCDEPMVSASRPADGPVGTEPAGPAVHVHDKIEDGVGATTLMGSGAGRKMFNSFVAFGAVQKSQEAMAAFPRLELHRDTGAYRHLSCPLVSPLVDGQGPLFEILFANDHPDPVYVA